MSTAFAKPEHEAGSKRSVGGEEHEHHLPEMRVSIERQYEQHNAC